MFVVKTDVGAQYRNVLTNQRIARHIVVQGKQVTNSVVSAELE